MTNRPAPTMPEAAPPRLAAVLPVIALLALASSAPLAAAPIEAGSAAPEFNLPGNQGSVRLSDYRGKTVYLDFWASWCGPCKQSFPWMNAMQAKYAAHGLQIVAINLDAQAADAASFLAGVPAAFTIAYDPAGSTAQQYRIKGMPSSVLIAPDGKVISLHAGFNQNTRRELEQQLHAALGVTP